MVQARGEPLMASARGTIVSMAKFLNLSDGPSRIGRDLGKY
jgi:hypothetical protein